MGIVNRLTGPRDLPLLLRPVFSRPCLEVTGFIHPRLRKLIALKQNIFINKII